MSRSVIEMTHVYKTFGEVPALHDMSLRVQQGEVVGLLGPNGAGKTTTVRLILGLLKPDKGDVRLFGEDPYPDDLAHCELRRRVGVVLEEDRLYPHMTGWENLQFWTELYGMPADKAPQEINRVLQLVEMADRATSKVGTYSKGMRRRLAIARSLVNRPDVLIMDEPTSGLDPEYRVQVRDILRRLAEQGMTILITSHNLAEVEKICTRVVIIKKGRILLSSTIQDLMREYGSELVITVNTDASTLRDTPLFQELTQNPMVKEVKLYDNTVRLALAEVDNVSPIIQLFTKHQVPVKEIQTISPSLEDIYLRIVKSADD
ncbi:MAG: ABC transporter ATP-binding protein [Chloroflexi bacterium]|nr:ABC transporter ATP-binding protein [Chloroflexota bacterium]